MSTPLRIAIIIGSTRPTRIGHQVGEWVHEHANRLGAADYEIIDLAEVDLPLLDEPMSASAGQYTHEHTKKWAERIAPFDGFIFVTPEYNHAPNAALVNALSFLYAEWNDKSAALVSYGYTASGARAADMLRPILGELQVADVRQQLVFSIPVDFENYTVFKPGEQHISFLQVLTEQLEAWGRALKVVRAEKALARAAA
ncbi:NADPH-dependent FMN reductase [Homoserinibacter sp. GY 40078]|uniref:NADPH-dependent FMN reductase n=1 Tax=Homoserinibacter sp. GY 40078 TaxID=2603275 RepID=UPI0011CA6E49|nr:NADPH-dependent FMN reductase [Homoserinibacter sp. GY 40078]TXK19005.1 NAD(P)H-dependent oxidoreductase [Homoserinibacter sp. GY 40078]